MALSSPQTQHPSISPGWARELGQGWKVRDPTSTEERLPPSPTPGSDWHLLGDLSSQGGAVQLPTSRQMGSYGLKTSRRKVGSKGPDSKPARAHSGTDACGLAP